MCLGTVAHRPVRACFRTIKVSSIKVHRPGTRTLLVLNVVLIIYILFGEFLSFVYIQVKVLYTVCEIVFDTLKYLTTSWICLCLLKKNVRNTRLLTV